VAGSTTHYGLQTLDTGDSLATNAYKFTHADRDQMDALLYLGAEGHHHTGAAASPISTAVAPTLTLFTAGGAIPAGVRLYYAYSYMDATGHESAGSTVAFVDTALPVTEPAAPALSTATTGGFLIPGNYYYVLSAYTGTITNETKALNPVYITVPAGTTTNTITLTMPSLPSGATGFNIYRRKPGGTNYVYLASTALTTYTDSGNVVEDPNRLPSPTNTTNSANYVEVDLPIAVPANQTWKVYRTYSINNWETSLLQWVTDETFEGSGIITPTYNDIGNGATVGKPPAAAQNVGSPSKIDLTAEVTGVLPQVNGGAGVGAASQFKKLTADTTSANAIQGSVSDLSFAVSASSTYSFDYTLFYDATSGADIGFSWSLPSGATILWSGNGLGSSATNPGVLTVSTSTSAGTILAFGGSGLGTIQMVIGKGIIITAGTAGTATFNFAQSVLDGSNPTKLRQNSFGHYWKDA
jgi:hypothetical protein